MKTNGREQRTETKPHSYNHLILDKGDKYVVVKTVFLTNGAGKTG